jgi:hypothetical protein
MRGLCVFGTWTAKGAVPHLGFGSSAGDMTLSTQGNLVEAAANLFSIWKAKR